MTDEERKELVERLKVFQQWLYDMDLSGLSEIQPNLRETANQIEADGTEIDQLRVDLEEYRRDVERLEADKQRLKNLIRTAIEDGAVKASVILGGKG